MGWLGYFVGRSKTLQYLYIDINDVPESEFLSMSDRIGVFIEGLSRNQSIEEIHIGSDLGSGNFRRMGDFFSNNNNLRELSFRSTVNMGRVDSAHSIAHMLSQCGQSSLRKISLDDSEASDAVLAEVAVAISNHSQLEELHLDGNNLGREGCAALGSVLGGWTDPQLKILYLQNNIIDDVGLSSLVTGLRNCHNLTKLALSGNELITVEGCRSLSTLFQSDHCGLNLTHLYLDNMNIGNDGVRTILAGLAKLHSLQGLYFRHNSIGNEGATALAAGLVNLRSLKILNLSHNSIGDDGAGALAAGLMDHLRSLKKLYLSGNSICNDGVSALAHALASLQSLEELNLAQNLIGDEGLQTLVDGILSHCSNLSWLSLDGNQSITPLGVVSLSTLLRSYNRSLISLSLLGINFGDDAAAALADGLKGKKLIKLLFSLNEAGLTSVGWSAFSKLLCDTSSVNNTYLSNHTLERIGDWENRSAPDDVEQFLVLNRYYSEGLVAIQKILKSHIDFDVESMLQWKLKLLPLVVSWFDRVSALVDDKEWIFLDESVEAIQRRKLTTIYKFVRGMPLLVVDDYRRNCPPKFAPLKRKIIRCLSHLLNGKTKNVHTDRNA